MTDEKTPPTEPLPVEQPFATGACCPAARVVGKLALVAIAGLVGWSVFTKLNSEGAHPDLKTADVATMETSVIIPPKPSGLPEQSEKVAVDSVAAEAVAANLETHGTTAKSDAAAAAEQDRKYREMVIGTWQDDYQGKRTMVVRPDGSATMNVELTGLKAALFASQLMFKMKWSIQNGRMKKQTTGGEPAGKVNLILKTMGDRVDEKILELTNNRLRLLDKNGKTEYDWRRVGEEADKRKQPADASSAADKSG